MLNLLLLFVHTLADRSRSERGEVSLEYVLVGGLMALAIIAGIGVLTGSLGGWFGAIAGYIDGMLPG